MLMVFPPIIFGQSHSPCDDSRFLTLKKKPLELMSEREYAYFKDYSRRCREYQQQQIAQKQEDFEESITAETKIKNQDFSSAQLATFVKLIGGGIVFYVSFQILGLL
jgi:hypothetical protein